MRRTTAITITLTALLVLTALFLGWGPARAQTGTHGVYSWLLSGATNTGKSCAELQGSYADEGTTWSEFKVEPVASGSYSDGNITVTITRTGNYFDWSSNIGLDAIVVKDGVDGASFYVYDGWSSSDQDDEADFGNGFWRDPEESEDTSLSTPKDGSQGISHISFCYDYNLGVMKDASASYDRTVTWELDKSASPEEHIGFIGESFDSTWMVTATKTVATDNYQVTGNITITNPSPTAVDFTISDVIDGDIDADVSCSSYTVPANGSVTCTYSADEDDGIDGTQSSNVVTVTSLTEGIDGGTTTADFTFTANVIGDDTVTVDDDRRPSGFPASIPDSTTFTYNETFSCSTNQNDYTDGVDSDTYSNTATATGDNTNLSASADVDVTCYVPSIEKTAAGTYDERHEWDVEKTVNPGSQSAFIGDRATFSWTITVDETIYEENFDVAGTITVDNPNPEDELVVSLVDFVSGHQATIDQTSCAFDGTDLAVAAGGSETCDYTADDLPYDDVDLAPTLNTATITLNGIDLEANDPIEWTATVIRGTATLDDDQYPYNDEPVNDGWTSTFEGSYTCSSDLTDYTSGADLDNEVSNTAEVYSGGALQDSSTATTEIDCYAPTVEKDATPEWEQSYDWTITKTVDPELHSGSPGDEFTSAYTVTVDRTFIETFQATGTISVTNPAGAPDAITVDVADAVGVYAGTVDCDGSGGTSLTVAAGETGTCSYTVDLPDNETRTNTATVTFNEINFTATADVVFDEPIVHGHPTINVTDYFDGDTVGESLGSASDDFTFEYSRDFECPADESLYGDGMYTDAFPNFAEIDETGQQDDANVDLTCTVEPVGRIIVDKVTDPSGAEQLFTFNPSWGPSFELADEDPPYDSGPLSPGTYFVTETVPAGWELDSAVCASSNPEDQETPGSISLQAGETVRCTFTNVGEPAYVFQKFINGEDADTLEEAVSVEAGDTLTFTYMLTNTGNAPITWTALTDDIFDDLTEECELPVDVPVGETATCDILRPAQEREQGQQNIGTASVEGLDDQTDPAWYRTSAPTPVELLYFRAQGTGSAIRLEWGVAAEIDMSGYYLYRAESSQFGLAERLAFQVAEGSYSTYEYVDKDVEPGKTYWYWLVSIETNGTKEREGPVQASMVASAPGGGFQIFLPFAVRNH